MTLQEKPTQIPPRMRDADWESGWVSAAVVFAVATVAAIVILGADWSRSQAPDSFSPPESKRMMVMAPWPR